MGKSGSVDFELYLITDRSKTKGRDLKEVIKRAHSAGANSIQLREKDLKAKDIFDLSKELRDIIPKRRGKIFINDRADIACGTDADGVHLGQSSIRADIVRGYFRDLLIGVSTHNLEEAKDAQRRGADFITFGPVFYTPSKAGFGEPVGIEALKKTAELVDIPVFAIGGIKKGLVKDVIDAGAWGVALISEVMEARNIEKAVGGIIKEIKRVKGAKS